MTENTTIDAMDTEDLWPKCFCNGHRWTSAPVKRTIGDLLLAAPVRSGSTVVHQILEEIIGDPVVKTHRLFADACPMEAESEIIFFCIRNPFDLVHSYMRYKNKKGISFEEIDEIFQDCTPLIKFIKIMSDPLLKESFAAGVSSRLVIVRYEDYWSTNNNLELVKYIAHKINPGLLDSTYTEKLKEISEKTSIDTNLKTAKGVTDGTPHDKIHDQHISPDRGKPGQGGKLLHEKYKKYITENYGGFFEYFGYNLGDNNEE
tara:strand:+ start:877 stop:1656 length:780 start_codon:yes stop_codon:yes gene_type:complete